MRALTAKDGYAIMTELVREATSQKTITVVNMSDYISAGETVLNSGYENVFNALGIVMGRLLVAARPYKAKLALINALNTDCYTSRMRKVSFYAKDPVASGMFNTDLFLNLKDKFTNGENEVGGVPQSTKSMWEQNQAMPLQVEFSGSTVFDYTITMYEEQVRASFRDPVELAQFVQGMLIEHDNDIESSKEAFNRMNLLSKIAATYYYDAGLSQVVGGAVNLTAAYNARFGTTYTSAQLRSTQLKSFLEFMVATIKKCSDYMTERTAKYHLPMTKTVDGVQYNILRHTPYNKQRLFLFEPLFREAESMVLPEIFHDDRLEMDNYEGVTYWQENAEDDEDRAAIKVKTSYYDTVTGEQKATPDIELDYVVGLLTDEDGIMTDFQLERVATTPLEAKKMYRNVILHFAKNAINDPSENAILFYMAD